MDSLVVRLIELNQTNHMVNMHILGLNIFRITVLIVLACFVVLVDCLV